VAPGQSAAVTIPPLDGELSRRRRCEFVLLLQGSDALARISSNHRRNVARARGQGIGIRRTRAADACAIHNSLVHTSLDRRTARGETIVAGNDVAPYERMTRTGAGELFQAVRGDAVLSSLLVLRARAGAYYQSAGTTPDGMAVGASHFLVSSIIASLRDEGLQVFNLGGAAEDASGLRRFKQGFGAVEAPLEAAQFSTEHPLIRAARARLRLLRANHRAFGRLLWRGRSSPPSVR
jgi:hypothetical protein